MPITFLDGRALAPTSYSNSGGQGNRSAIITVTSDAFAGSGAVQNTVDGSETASNATAVRFFGGGCPNQIKYHFTDGQPRWIDEVTLVIAGGDGTNEGTWKFRWSKDNVTYVDVSSSFSWSGTLSKVVTLTPPDEEGALWYSLENSVANVNDPFFCEIKFKIAPGA